MKIEQIEKNIRIIPENEFDHFRLGAWCGRAHRDGFGYQVRYKPASDKPSLHPPLKIEYLEISSIGFWEIIFPVQKELNPLPNE
jgi:hypothetical protein